MDICIYNVVEMSCKPHECRTKKTPPTPKATFGGGLRGASRPQMGRGCVSCQVAGVSAHYRMRTYGTTCRHTVDDGGAPAEAP